MTEGHSDVHALVEDVTSCEDPRRGLAMLEEEITRCTVAGEPVPEDLVRLRRALMCEVTAESQGR